MFACSSNSIIHIIHPSNNLNPEQNSQSWSAQGWQYESCYINIYVIQPCQLSTSILCRVPEIFPAL